MTHRCDIQVRFNDTDALGHLNNNSFAQYAEYARIVFFRDVGVPTIRLILAHLSLDFRKQVYFADPVYVETCVEKIGNSSITMKQTVFANQEPACEIRSVTVHFNYESQKSEAVPAEVRQLLADYLIRSPIN